jgi:DNA polymerase III subunit alpha
MNSSCETLVYLGEQAKFSITQDLKKEADLVLGEGVMMFM